jgi:hypothetical protein
MEPTPTRWRIYVVAYLVWLILFTVVEGAGRWACRVPMRKWVTAAADERDRTARLWFRDRADECLGYTAWYRFSMAGLLVIVAAAPLVAVRLVRRRLRERAPDRRPFLRHAALVYSVAFVATLAVAAGTMAGVRWLYDWYA